LNENLQVVDLFVLALTLKNEDFQNQVLFLEQSQAYFGTILLILKGVMFSISNCLW